MSEATKPIAKPLTRSEWGKTPYATTTARNTDEGIEKLLAKYGVKEKMFASYISESGRESFGVRFVLKGRAYRVAFETLPTMYSANVAAEDKMRQVKRAVYYTLKALMETATVFATMEQILFPFAEIPNTAKTMFEIANPSFDRIGPANIGFLMIGNGEEKEKSDG